MPPEIEAPALKQELNSPNPPLLLDVREPDELRVSRFENIIHIPLAEMPGRIAELDKEADWVVVCRSGARSNQAATYLMAQGFTKVRNLAGGMNGWARKIDQSMKLY